MLIKAPDFESARQKQDSQHDATVKILFKAFNWLVTEDFKSLLKFLHELGQSCHRLGNLNVLNMSNINYISAFTDILQSITSIAKEDLQREFTNSPIVTGLAD